MAGIAIAIGLSSPSQEIVASWGDRPQRTIEAIDGATGQVLDEIERHIKEEEFAGGISPGGGKVGSRTGGLLGDITHEITGFGRGEVGTTEKTSHYANTILGPDDTTIRPKDPSKKLWVPTADNLTPSGVVRMTPRAMFDEIDRRRIRIFDSKAGNTVVLVTNPLDADGAQPRFKRDVTKGRNAGRVKGDLKGRLMFVLKDSVVIEGTDALARGVAAMGERSTQIYETWLREALS